MPAIHTAKRTKSMKQLSQYIQQNINKDDKQQASISDNVAFENY